MTYVRVAVVLALLLFLWPLATPAGPSYLRLLARVAPLAVEAMLGGALLLTWSLRRLAEVLFLRASGGRLKATARE